MKKAFRSLSSLLLILVLTLTLLFSTGCGENFRSFFSSLSNWWGNTSSPSSALQGVDASEGRDEFISSIGGTSETFRGTVSESVYSSPSQAAEAYVFEQVLGYGNGAYINDIVSMGELSSGEIDALGLPEEIAANAVAVEKMQVMYEQYSNSRTWERDSSPSNAPVNTSKTVTVYVIKYQNDWKYFTPCPITGDTITKDYYDSVFNSEKYKNCTLVNTVSVTVDAKGYITVSMDGETESQSLDGAFNITVAQTIMHDNGKIFFEQTITTSGSGAYAQALPTSSSYLAAYLEETTDYYGYTDIEGYVRTDPDGDWYPGNIYDVGFSSIEELRPFYDQYLDHSYFTKSDFGFVISDENAMQYIELAMEELTKYCAQYLGADADFNMYAEFYVNDGVLSGLRNDCEIAIDATDFLKESVGHYPGASIDAEFKMYASMNQTTSVTDYGSTVVSNPAIK